MDTADFALRLHDQVSGPAGKAKRSLIETESAMDRLRRASALQDKSNKSELRSRMAARRKAADHAERTAVRARRKASLETQGGQMERVRHQQAVKKAREAAMRAQGIGPSQGGGMGAEVADGFGLSKFAGIAGIIAGVGMAVGFVTSKVIEMGAAFSSALFDAMDFGQRSQIALTSILKSAPLAAQQFNEVRAEAAKLGLDVFKTVDSFKMLANSGFDVATSRQLVRLSADLQTLTGSGESAEFALRAISQIKMKGRLQAEEITGQLAEHGVSADEVYKVLGKTLGKTRQEILKMQKAGDVSADVAIPAILQAVRNQLGKTRSGEFALEIAQGSISGMGRQLKAGLQNALISLGQDIAPAATSVAQRFFGTIQKIAASPAVGRARDKIVEMFQSAATWVEQNWPQIEPMILRVADQLANGFAHAADFLLDHGEEMRTTLVGLGAVTGALAADVMVLTGFVYALAAGVGYVVGKLVEWETPLGNAAGLVLAFINPVAKLVALWTLLGDAIGYVSEKFNSIPARLQSIVLPVSMSGLGAMTGAGGAPTAPIASSPLQSTFGNVGAAEPKAMGGTSKTLSVGQISVPVQALDLDDPAQAGATIGAIVRREIQNGFENL